MLRCWLPDEPSGPTELTCAEIPALCCRRGWWQSPVLNVMWERKVTGVILSRPLQLFRIRTLERRGRVLCQTEWTGNSGFTLCTERHKDFLFTWRQCAELKEEDDKGPHCKGTMGKLLTIIPTQKNTKMAF